MFATETKFDDTFVKRFSGEEDDSLDLPLMMQTQKKYQQILRRQCCLILGCVSIKALTHSSIPVVQFMSGSDSSKMLFRKLFIIQIMNRLKKGDRGVTFKGVSLLRC